MQEHEIKIPTGEDARVSGVVHVPDGYLPRSGTGVILAHGAGNDMRTPMLRALSEELCGAGILTLRFNFPYKEKGRKAPDRMPVLINTWEAAGLFLKNHRDWEPRRIAAAGKSMGGRAASMAAAERKLFADSLIFFGYPLHPPGRKDKLRDAHLYRIGIPMLFFAGTRDPLCDLSLLRPVLDGLRAPHDLEVISGGDHSFRMLKSSGLTSREVWERLALRTISWLEEKG